jgi:hypothetical protein
LRLLFPAILAILLVGLILCSLTDRGISVADTAIPNKDVAGTASKVSYSSASATIRITMVGVLNE